MVVDPLEILQHLVVEGMDVGSQHQELGAVVAVDSILLVVLVEGQKSLVVEDCLEPVGLMLGQNFHQTTNHS